MSGFKLLAIRPIKGCSRRFLKILKEDEIYKFYNDYDFEINKDNQVVDIIPLKKTPRNLYKIHTSHKDINLNISAIVGKNGSGKSSLVELLFMVINNIAKPNIPNNIKPLYNVVENKDDCLIVELFFETTSIYKILIKDDYKKPSISTYKLTDSGFKKLINFNLRDFFYSIAVNYSVYSLDSRELGDWLTEVFHKNDSYQTPLVLNPFRKEGNINYESEKGLINDRLLTNILRKKVLDEVFDFRMLTEKQKVESIDLNLNSIDYNSKVLYSEEELSSKKEKFEVCSKDLIHYKNLLFKILSKKLNFDFSSVDIKKDVNKKALEYIFYKTFKIAETYKVNYGDLFDFRKKTIKGRLHTKTKKNDLYISNINKYLDNIFLSEGTHITNKIRQTVNFLKYNNQNLIRTNEKIFLGVEVLSNNIDELLIKTKSKNIKRIEFIPPPIYDIDYALSSIDSKETKTTKFSLLSSGEKQKIHSVSSIIYHLINIDSVIQNENIVQYKNVNIIFEEIELYFHPDMQRTFVKFMYDSIRSVLLQNIDSINIILVTHSPFILSDIPNTNILYLDIKKQENEVYRAYPINKKANTFGANIHKLLSDSFFMDKGYMGEFAKGKINRVISFIEDGISSDIEEIEEIQSIISLIGEPVIKNRLEKLYNEKYPAFSIMEKSYEDKLKQQREILKQLEAKVNNQK